MLHLKEPQTYKQSQRSNIDNCEIVDPNDYITDVDNHEKVDPNDYVTENPASSELPGCSAIPTTKRSSPNISPSVNLAITNPPSQDFTVTDNLAIKSSLENSPMSNLEMLTSLATQLATASTDGSMTSQGPQVEEVDLARYTSEPAYVQPQVKPNYEDKIFHSLQLVPCDEDVEMVDAVMTRQERAYVELQLVPCYEDVEMVDAAMTRQERAYVELNLNSVQSVSYGEDVEVVDAQHRKKIKGEKAKKKCRKQRNMWSDQPAKLPPLPAESELFDDPDPEPELQRRKNKSLSVLAEKMLSMFPMEEMDSVIHLDKTAASLGVDLRRLYTVVDVFEALHIMSRVGMNLYKWHGSNFLIQTLVWLREIAVEMGVPEQYELVKAKELDAILRSAQMKYKISEETSLESPMSEILTCTSPPTPASSPESPSVSPGYNCAYFGSTSLGINTQLLMMMMLVAPDPKTVNLEFAASVLHGSSKLKHNPQRRFLDIANILSSLGLIQKVRITSCQGLRNAYQYTGPCVENMEVPESIKMSMPFSRQKNSLLPYPKPYENASKSVEVLENREKKQRGSKQGSKQRVVNCSRIKKAVNQELRIRDDKRKKKCGSKLRQKNTKKVKVEIIITEILDSVINEIFETPKKLVLKKRGRKRGSKKKVVANCMGSEKNLNDEIIIVDKCKKKIVRKPGQKNAKKVKVGIIIAETLDSIINESFQTSEKIKKELGKKFGSKKKEVANCMVSKKNVNDEVMVPDENGKKKRGRKLRQNYKKVKTETVIAEILDTVINEISGTPKKIRKRKQARTVDYRNVNNNHKTVRDLNQETNIEASGEKNRVRKLHQKEEVNETNEVDSKKKNIKMRMDILERKNPKIQDRPAELKKADICLSNENAEDIKIDEANNKVKSVQKRIQKTKGKVFRKRVVNDEKIVEVNNKKTHKRKFDQKEEETKRKVKRGQELVQKSEEKVLSERAVNDEKIVEVKNKKTCKRKIVQKNKETIQIEADNGAKYKENCETNCERKSEKKVKVGLNNNDNANFEKLGIRRSSRIQDGKKKRNDLNDVWKSTGENKTEKQRKTEKEELLNYLKLVASHTSV